MIQKINSIEFRKVLKTIFPDKNIKYICAFNSYFDEFIDDDSFFEICENLGYNPFLKPFKYYSREVVEIEDFEPSENKIFKFGEPNHENIFGIKFIDTDLFPNETDFVRLFENIDYEKETEMYFLNDETIKIDTIFKMQGIDFIEFAKSFRKEFNHALCDFEGNDHIILFKNLGILLLIRNEGYKSEIHFKDGEYELIQYPYQKNFIKFDREG